jgi:uncharacterized protein YecT (DUF1311 family)
VRNNLITTGQMDTNMKQQCLKTLCTLATLLAAGTAVADDCADPKTSSAIAQCLAQDLRHSDDKINSSYQELMSKLDDPVKAELRRSQRAWIKERDSDCGTDTRETDREKWYQFLSTDYGKIVCVTRHTQQRTATLERMLEKPSVNDSQKTPPAPVANDKLDYRLLSKTSRDKGLWYYEVTVNPAEIAPYAPTTVWFGCRLEHQYAGGLFQVRAKRIIGQPMIGGIALDLDAGKIYVRIDGRWIVGEPGSSSGEDIKLGQQYRCGVETTALLAPLLANGSVEINYGKTSFVYLLPAGYRPFSDDGE